ncbi:NADH-quinone oxidoreductase subunit L [Puerhibacterium puerhi]|uniref:NADH-quinone oxidoreductase subunit L n=1 Tax=Puerhibacterium puerhi TaxID=2692623 RepID=UPI00135B1DBC|nr:NADH-quinone oxidoreductase subunit L [Puerhibacterium puerhi]
MQTLGLMPWLVGLPALGALVLVAGGRRLDRWGHWLGVAASAGAFVVGLVVLVDMLARPAADRVGTASLGTWLDVGTLQVDAGLRADPLSMTFVVLVTFVGSLIHVYSVAYMAHDADRRRFFGYLNLFVAAMLLLVLADGYLLLFVGWEGVGLASFLLIGFWDRRRGNAVAGKKAFVMNRVGDMGLVVAMMLLLAQLGSLSYADVLPRAGELGTGVATAVGLMLLLAACGKSAQVPLQAWLGDAMAGPTPVSALIHAATMVTAGVYLLVRSAPILEAAPAAQLVVAVVGVVTLLFGAVVGCAKDDIKKALAASTMSQIGYMMLAAGLGPAGYAFAIFHLVTHGFFKAGLFLGAGSVMHAMGDEVDMRRFGGLARLLPVTAGTMALGWLAIIGVPPFSGFWSKDLIVEAAFTGEGWRPWVFGGAALLGAGITAFYMSRLMFMTFGGRRRWAETGPEAQHPHEAPALMRWPMVVLAVGSVALGGLLAVGGAFTAWLEPVVGPADHHEPVLPVPLLIALTLVLVVVGVVLAFRTYAAAPVPVVAPASTALVRAARRDLYQDAVNETAVMVPGQVLTRTLVYADRAGVDSGFLAIASAVRRSGDALRRLQNGYVRSYAATTLGGLLGLAVVVWALAGWA